MKRIAFYGGSFDPPHKGHLTIAHALLDQFKLDKFVFVPAFQAPHKMRHRPTSAYDRYAMLCLVTQNEPKVSVSKMEIETPERPYSVETLTRLNDECPNDDIFFVMGADSWMEITAWREWEKVLSLANHIVVTRPGVEIGFSHVTDEIRNRIIDLRQPPTTENLKFENPDLKCVYVTDAVNLDLSATKIRQKIRDNVTSWREDVPAKVANYIEKYQIYK